MTSRIFSLFLFCTLLTALLAGCTAQPTPALPTAAPTLNASPTPSATATATARATSATAHFDETRAFADLGYQLSLGARTPDSPGHAQIIQWMQSELTQAGWQVEIQEVQIQGHTVRNVIAKRGVGKSPWYILGAHYDTRMSADQDKNPAFRQTPVPGANDAASGVAVLLELARSLPETPNLQIWLAFFDLEDQGDLPGWNWILGSTVLAESVSTLNPQPTGVVVIDMIGDAQLNIPIERNSDAQLSKEIWATAARLHYDHYFLPKPGYSMEDDHTPFLQKHIPALDIIDFDYPAWHTTTDDLSHVSANSLKVVGETLLQWLMGK